MKKEEKINILINIFETNQNIKEELCEKLKLLNNKKKIIGKLHKIILLLKDLNLEQNNIQKSLEKSINKLKNNPSLKELMEINLNLNILDSNLNSKALSVIENKYEKKEIIDIIINKEVNDIHQMGEFIDDSEDVYITISEITFLEKYIQFIKKFKKINYSEK